MVVVAVVAVVVVGGGGGHVGDYHVEDDSCNRTRWGHNTIRTFVVIYDKNAHGDEGEGG